MTGRFIPELSIKISGRPNPFPSDRALVLPANKKALSTSRPGINRRVAESHPQSRQLFVKGERPC